MVERNPQHIDMLLTEFSRRKFKNPRYSMRAFAQFLGMSTPTLSRVLSGTQEISLTACKKILKKLKFNDYQSLVFVRSIAEEKCSRTYKVLSTAFNDYDIYPHEKNVLIVSNLEKKCLYVNDIAQRLNGDIENESMTVIMTKIGFSEDAIQFVDECLNHVVQNGIAEKHHLPLDTMVGRLVIDSIFSPLMGRNGRVEAVASVFLNLNLDVLKL